MKTAAVVKIVIWSVVALLLLGLFLSIHYTDKSKIFSIVSGWSEGDLEVLRVQSFPVENIDSIDLKWSSGTFIISPTDGNQIIVTEKANRELTEGEMLQISVDNGKIRMEQGTQISRIFIFSFGYNQVNEIRLPEKQYRELKARMSSGKLIIDKLDCNRVDIGLTSGLVEMSAVNASDLLLDMTSGKADLEGSFDDLYVDSTSGSIYIKSEQAPSAMFIDITSGKAVITIPENEGFVVGKRITSGVFRSDFAIDDFGRYKDGENRYRINMTSGVVELKRK